MDDAYERLKKYSCQKLDDKFKEHLNKAIADGALSEHGINSPVIDYYKPKDNDFGLISYVATCEDGNKFFVSYSNDRKLELQQSEGHPQLLTGRKSRLAQKQTLNEAKTLEILSDSKHIPQSYGIIHPSDDFPISVLVSECIDGKNFGEFTPTKSDIANVMKAYGEFFKTTIDNTEKHHQLSEISRDDVYNGAPMPLVFSREYFIDMAQGAIELIGEQSADIDDLKQSLMSLRERANSQPTVIANTDNHPGNIMQEKDGNIKFIDWEYPGFMKADVPVAGFLANFVGEGNNPRISAEEVRVYANICATHAGIEDGASFVESVEETMQAILLLERAQEKYRVSREREDNKVCDEIMVAQQQR